MGFFEKLRRIAREVRKPGSGTGKTSICEIVPSDVEFPEDFLGHFSGPLGDDIPSTRRDVYMTYGRAPKDSGLEDPKYPKAKMVIAKDLPGDWNGGKVKLYMLAYMEPYLREALSRCKSLKVLDHITKIGCYNHRNIRFDPEMPLSYHSWGAAVDINPGSNGPVSKDNRYVPPPFSKGWLEIWPNHLPYYLVRAFRSVGFTWGGDWGNDSWIDVVELYGQGYDHRLHRVEDWEKVNFVDPMHFELISR